MSILIRTSVLVIFFIGCFDATNGEGERDIMFNHQHYEEERVEAKRKLYETALKVCPDKKKEVQEKLDEYEDCSSQIDEANNTMCEVIEINLNTCIVPLFDYYETCVPHKAQGLPTYALNTARRLVTYVCEIDGRHFIELGNHCILKKDHISTRKCIRKFNRDAAKYHYENLPTREEICIYIDDFKSCFDSHVERFCKDSTTREAYKGLYNVFLCKK